MKINFKNTLACRINVQDTTRVFVDKIVYRISDHFFYNYIWNNVEGLVCVSVRHNICDLVCGNMQEEMR